MTTEQNITVKVDTWPKVLKYNYEKFNDKHRAMRHKDLGIWNVYTWKDYYLSVKHLALGLLGLGFKAGDSLLVLGDNAPEYYFAELAAQANHGIAIGAYPDANVREIKYLLESSKCKFVIVQDQEQVDKILQIIDQFPDIKNVIYWIYKGLAHYHNPILLGYRELVNLGKDFEFHNPEIFEQNIKTGKAEDISNIIYTSGTEGAVPKGVLHTYKSMRASVDQLLSIDPWNQKDNIVLQSPPVGINEQYFGIGCHLLSASVLNFAESPVTQLQDYREIGPDIVFYNPRLWENQVTAIKNRLRDADSLSSFFYRLYMPTAYKIAESKYKKKSANIFSKVWYAFANILMLRQMRDNLGLPNARVCYSSGAWLDSDVIRFYNALNIPLKNIYSSTEGGALTGFSSTDIRPDTLGAALPGVELKVTGNGEIAVRSNGLFTGYQDGKDIANNRIKDGWFHSGDAGSISNDGQLVFTDRIGDIAKLSNGEQFYPQFIEGKLRSSPFISDAWVTCGPDGKFIAAIIIINYDRVGKWAGLKKLSYKNFPELAQKPEVYELVKHEITKINKVLPPNYRIAKWAHLHKEFDPEESEFTRNRKLKRSVLNKHYDQILNAIYNNMNEVAFNTQIKHRDGRAGVTTTNIAIKSI